MKKIIIYLFFALFSGVILTSCEDMFGDFLDKAPGADLTEDEVFSDFEKTKDYFFDMYNFLPTGLNYINNSWLDGATDLAVTSYPWGGTKNSLNIGSYYSSGAAPEVNNKWYHAYRLIRKVNIFLDEVDFVPLNSNETEFTRNLVVIPMKAEARFLRAYFYWELVMRYGPVPIIVDRLEPNDPNLNKISRPATIDTCINFILSEFEDIYPNLLSDDKGIAQHTTQSGRITQGILLALRSRILLFLASPQYNSSNDVTKWQVASDAALAFINTFGQNGNQTYGLFNDAVQSESYPKVFITPVYSENNEPIFWRRNTNGDWWQNESPVSFGGYGGLCPSQNLVDMYDMNNGSSPFTEYDETGAPIYSDELNGVPSGINGTSGYNDQDPYTGRDSRFYKTVLYNGAIWWNTPIDTYEGGKDKPVGNSDATPTGYYKRKYHDDVATHYLYGGTVSRNFTIIRYAEILLNYAEARNEVLAAPDAEVYNALQMLRNRAGIAGNLQTDRPMTKEQMRNFIRKERAVELCFEELRWWDVRRWKVAEKALARPIYGMKIVKNGANLSYTRVKVQDRYFVPKMYLYPIPEEEIWKTGMNNNPGW